MKVVSDSSEPDEILVERFTRVLERLIRQFRLATAPDGLSPSAASALLRLADGGPQRVTDLARAEGITQPGMTQLVARLVGEGLAARASSDDDRRAVLVEATPAGVERVKARHAVRVERIAQLLDTLEPHDRELAFAAIPALERLVDAAIDVRG